MKKLDGRKLRNLAKGDQSHDKLWVFDTGQYLEVYAPTLEDALKEVSEVEKVSGLEFVQAPEWESYQQQHIAESLEIGSAEIPLADQG